MELVQANWLLFIVALLIGIAVAYWVFVATRRTRVETDASDALSEGAAPAARNQALIDAAPANAPPPVAVPPAVPAGMSGAGTAVAAAAAAAAEQQAEMAPVAAPAPAPAPEPEAEAEAETISSAPQAADDLGRIKGVGPKLQALLNTLGVTSFSQIAAWTDEDIDRIDAQLGRFEGRIRRDSWVEQAGFLAGGDTQGYEGKFGKL